MTYQQSFLLPGMADNRFESALERYGVWPTTVWEINYSDRATLALKAAIGDPKKGAGSARDECFTKASSDKSIFRGKVTATVFSPAVAAYCLNLYGLKTGGSCFDPFAGGGTRAVMAAKFGMRYEGCEIRREEVAAVERRCASLGLDPGAVTLHHGDAREAVRLVAGARFDLVLTCPPYWNLEQYGGGERDLSMAATYESFLLELDKVIKQTFALLRKGGVSCWVVGIFRDKGGALLSFPHDVVRLHKAAGFVHKEEVILAAKNNGAIQRVGNVSKGKHFLVRTHEYLEVFTKDSAGAE